MIRSAVHCRIRLISPSESGLCPSVRAIRTPLYSLEFSTIVDPSYVNVDPQSDFLDIGAILEVDDDSVSRYGIVPSHELNNLIRHIVAMAELHPLSADSLVLRPRSASQENIDRNEKNF